MRKLLIGLVVVFIVLAGVVFVAVSNLNGYLEENRETLAGLASDAAGREVRFEKAEVAFSGGLAVRVAGLRVGEDPRFGKPDFLALDDAYVGVRILPALSGNIEVSGIRLDAPTIRVIQTRDGYNFESLGGGGGEAAPDPDPDAAPLALAIAALEIDGGTIVYEDRTSADGLALVIEDFTSTGTDLTLDGPIAIDFSGLVRSSKQGDEGLGSEVEGEVRLAGLDPLRGTVALESPSLQPALFGVRLEEGETIEHLDSLRVDVELTPDPPKAGYPVSIRSSEARLAGFDLSDIAIDVNYRSATNGSAVQLDQVAVGLAGGTVEMNGDVFLGPPGASPFDLKTKVRALDAGELAHVVMGVPAAAVSGTLGGDVDLAGDSLEWASLKKSLVGKLRLDVGAGALEQVNVLNSLVGNLSADPGIGQLAAASIRDVVPEALSGDRTPFDGIGLALEVLDGTVHARDLKIAAQDFAIDAVGKVGLDGALSADGTFRFSEALSEKILAKADRLAPALGQDGIVTLPLRIGGTTEAPTIAPDLAALSGKAKDELKNRAAEALADKLFGKPKEGDSDAEKADRNATENLLKEGLGRFLGR
ncbi:MAG: AsmA-like C-terminal region-containing protein [Myxococcota bacterium]